MDLLRHLAEAKVNTAVAGPMVARLSVPEDDVRILWGPLGGEAGFVVVPADAALGHLEAGGGWVVYNPARARSRIDVVTGRRVPAVDPINDSTGSAGQDLSIAALRRTA